MFMWVSRLPHKITIRRSQPLYVAALLAAVGATTQLFWDAEPAAGKLLLPYLAWTAYATVLNAWIWNKNPKVGL